MKIPQPVELIGSPGSPYTRKMLALLRYRRIPYHMIWADPNAELGKRNIPAPKLVFLPTFLYRDDAGNSVPRSDSTPIIRELEQAFIGRSVLPGDPALAFIDYLLEDFADEWCTKYMFHYRWHFAADADNAGSLLPTYMDVTLPADKWRQFKTVFSERQVGRLRYVGSNDDTAPVIDASYRRLLQALENHFANLPFLLGRRPGAGDFALFGQFSQLVGFDPTPRAIAHELSMRTVGWMGLAEDLSGLEPVENDWSSPRTCPIASGVSCWRSGGSMCPRCWQMPGPCRPGKSTGRPRSTAASGASRRFPTRRNALAGSTRSTMGLPRQTGRGSMRCWRAPAVRI